MYSIPNTPDNVALSAVISRRIKSDASLIAATASMRRFLGYGGFGLLIGAGIGSAFFGYSYITDGRTSVEKLSEAMANALDHVVIKTDGSVTLEPGSKVGLEPSTVGLEPGSKVGIEPGSTVGIEPGSKVAVDTPPYTRPPNDLRPDMRPSPSPSDMRPSPQQLQPNASPASRAKTVTNYTIFKNVEITNGVVVSGWDFHSNEDTTPFHQFCYFISNDDRNEVASVKYNIAIDHRIVTPKTKLPFDLQTAYSNCVWFQEENPVSPTPIENRKRA